ncbi:MAG: sulfatase-like hydrolase/transferase, partial [Cyclobacteriaceae bacterium]|nr:sulfatase-like hydrolase/transferase [Cyclobacteriaceae bacterium]
MKKIHLSIVIAGLALLFTQACHQEKTEIAEIRNPLALPVLEGANRPHNVIFILSDDHRYDFMGFTGKIPWLETPNMDRLAAEGAHFPNAFVTTSLCSPSRASILTGMYSHSHTIVDNQAPMPEGLTFFPEYLQESGYQTGFFGKWHMGDMGDAPQPGFDHWESFRGQGTYYKPTLNINGERTEYPDTTYISDLLTDHALDWMDNVDKEKPFFMYLS